MFYDIIKYIVTTVIGAVIAGLIAYIKVLKLKYQNEKKKEKETEDAIKDAVKVLLRSVLKDQCQYYINKGSIRTEEFEELEEAMRIYESLNGNGTIHRLWEAVKELPII